MLSLLVIFPQHLKVVTLVMEWRACGHKTKCNATANVSSLFLPHFSPSLSLGAYRQISTATVISCQLSSCLIYNGWGTELQKGCEIQLVHGSYVRTSYFVKPLWASHPLPLEFKSLHKYGTVPFQTPLTKFFVLFPVFSPCTTLSEEKKRAFTLNCTSALRQLAWGIRVVRLS